MSEELAEAVCRWCEDQEADTVANINGPTGERPLCSDCYGVLFS